MNLCQAVFIWILDAGRVWGVVRVGRGLWEAIGAGALWRHVFFGRFYSGGACLPRFRRSGFHEGELS